MSDREGLRSRLSKLSLAICFACAVALIALFYPTLRVKILKIEPWTADWRTVLLSDRVSISYPGIVVVIINNKTLEGYPYTSPTPRDLIAKVVRSVDAAHPAVIGLDFYFAKPTDKDNDLIGALRMAKAPIVVGAIDRRYPQFTPAEFDFQKQFLAATGRCAGYNELLHEKDDVVRYTAAPADPDYPESFALLVAKSVKPSDLPSPTRIAWLLGPDTDLDPFATISAETLFQDTGMDAATLGRAQEQAQRLNGKVVLISGEYPYLDRHRTPLSLWTGSNMLGVKIHANIVAQLVDGRRYFALSVVQQEILFATLSVLGFVLGWYFWRRRVDFLSLGVATVGLVVIDAIIFKSARIVLPFTLALWGWFIGATLGHHLHAVWAASKVRYTRPHDID
ncbi:adenylate cyclase [Hyphomicrobium denitrificans 1NES1]|uniref:Adenylate cyclase n=1 Tax=Hyphomicrobium denitrificans 1NES1 TaxID=670307 RepID=N0B0B6_9HYPH|nr:CHASE2 domain-containing protein [Hyphomicrobium denitrificans]AGK56343.1 adenylate cyclase [Hyphomicrobium denitrificans 1NES1]